MFNFSVSSSMPVARLRIACNMGRWTSSSGDECRTDLSFEHRGFRIEVGLMADLCGTHHVGNLAGPPIC